MASRMTTVSQNTNETTSERTLPNFKLHPGMTFETPGGIFLLSRTVTDTSIGASYIVKELGNTANESLLKIERELKDIARSALNQELVILKALAGSRGKMTHFVEIFERGKKELFYYARMQLTGPTISELKAKRLNKVFSASTGLNVATQCIESIEDLQSQGFVHRDIRASHFAVGCNTLDHVVYLIDFYCSKKIVKGESGEIKAPRSKVAYRGATRFAPIAGHKLLELGMKDDVESWFYLMLDMLVSQGLPWRGIRDKNEVLRLKFECRDALRDRLFGTLKCSKYLWQILKYVDSLNYTDRVDYKFIYNRLANTAVAWGVKRRDQLDWHDSRVRTSPTPLSNSSGQSSKRTVAHTQN